MTLVSIIAAVSENGVIGKDNKLPWYIPEDLAWFKEKTRGKPIVMGRKTHESIGKKLPGRLNIVISRDPDYQPSGKGIVTYTSLKAALDDNKKPEIVAIGGFEIYKEALGFANKMYLTRILAKVDGDTYFPDYKEDEWKVCNKKMSSNKDFLYEFTEMEKK